MTPASDPPTDALTVETTIKEFLLDCPSRTRFFERQGMDYTCSGFNRSLSRACAEHGIPAVEAFKHLLRRQPLEWLRGPRDWSEADAVPLTEHIRLTHHAYLSREMPWLRAAIDRVCQRQGRRHPALIRLGTVFSRLVAAMNDCAMKEEFVLFPAIRGWKPRAGSPALSRGSIACGIAHLSRTLRQAQDYLAEMWRLTDGYVPPADAGRSHRNVLDDLAELQAVVIRYTREHEEVLFPKIRALTQGATDDPQQQR